MGLWGCEGEEVMDYEKLVAQSRLQLLLQRKGDFNNQEASDWRIAWVEGLGDDILPMFLNEEAELV